MPHPFDGVASNKRLPFRLGTALESIQKYAAGAAPSYVNPYRKNVSEGRNETQLKAVQYNDDLQLFL